MKMKVEVLLVLLCAFDLYDGIDSIPYTIYGDGNKKIYLLDLYTCVEEFEEYCHQIPRFSVQAAAEVANNCTNLLPGYTIYTSALKTTRSIASGKVHIQSYRRSSCIIFRVAIL